MPFTDYRRIVLRAGFLLFAAAVLAQARPNFTGTWKMDVPASDFGPMPAPERTTVKVAHQDPEFKVNVTQVNQQGETVHEIAYTTDGKENTNTLNGTIELRSTSRWDGDFLVIDAKGNTGDREFTMKDRWALSEEGKTLTIERVLASSQGEAKMKMIFRKQ
jgi:hypothetical protein